MKRTTILLLTSLAISLYGASAQAILPRISVTTPNPESEDTIVITAEGTLSTPCWNVTHTMTRTGNTFAYQFDLVEQNPVCIQIIGAYGTTNTIVGLPPGDYLVTLDERSRTFYGFTFSNYTELKFIVRDNTGGGCLICIPGDVNLDGIVTIGDALHMVRYIFSGSFSPPPCPERWDIDGNLSTNISDVLALVRYIFLSGKEPVCGQ